MTEKIVGFRGKAAIVTGAGNGIGLATANLFAERGTAVIIAEINKDAGERARRRLSSKTQCVFVPTDVGKEGDVRRAVEEAISHYGRLDFVINNAADTSELYTPIARLSLQKWQRALDVNLTGPMLMAKYAAEHLTAAGGAIVNISSTRALMSEGNTEAYSATKAGLVGLTHSLALSLGPEVRVNCISPGWIDTSEYRAQPSDAGSGITDADHKMHPAGRVGLPADIAEMVLYLCSSAAGFITGQNFVIDGGMTKKMIY